jgi:CRP-like cAMP-binding protein
MSNLSYASNLARGYDPSVNKLLSAMTGGEFEQLRRQLEHVSLALNEVIYEAEERADYIYFPLSCIISLIYITEDGATAEIGLIGNDGVVGIFAVMGKAVMPHRAVVQNAGMAFKVKTEVLKREFSRCGQFHQLLLHYTQLRLLQVSQTAVCNRLHSIEQRLCRWLLLCHDRIWSDELVMTQELLATMLGVRREGVTVAAGRMQDAGAISYARGRIKILDRAQLEASVCECYQVLRDKTEDLLP